MLSAVFVGQNSVSSQHYMVHCSTRKNRDIAEVNVFHSQKHMLLVSLFGKIEQIDVCSRFVHNKKSSVCSLIA